MLNKKALKELVKIANSLDQKGLFDEARELDEIIMAFAGKKKQKKDKKCSKCEKCKCDPCECDKEKEQDAEDPGKRREPPPVEYDLNRKPKKPSPPKKQPRKK